MRTLTTYSRESRRLRYLAAYIGAAILLAVASQSLVAGASQRSNGALFQSEHVGPTLLERGVASPGRITAILSGRSDLAIDQAEPDTVLTLTSDDRPAALFLDQNYPNPFREHTTIRYGIPRAAFVKVTVHTMLGSPVLTLVNERQDPGTYTIDVNRHDLMPGMYFYKIETRYGSLTRRLTVSSL